MSVTTLTGGALLFSDWMNGPLFLSLLVGWIIMGLFGIMGATAFDLASELSMCHSSLVVPICLLQCSRRFFGLGMVVKCVWLCVTGRVCLTF